MTPTRRRCALVLSFTCGLLTLGCAPGAQGSAQISISYPNGDDLKPAFVADRVECTTETDLASGAEYQRAIATDDDGGRLVVSWRPTEQSAYFDLTWPDQTIVINGAQGELTLTRGTYTFTSVPGFGSDAEGTFDVVSELSGSVVCP